MRRKQQSLLDRKQASQPKPNEDDVLKMDHQPDRHRRNRHRLNQHRETIADGTTAALNVRSNSRNQPLLFRSLRAPRRQMSEDEMRATHKTSKPHAQRVRNSNDHKLSA